MNFFKSQRLRNSTLNLIKKYLGIIIQMFIDKALHEKAKRMANEIYAKPSAFKSGFIVKTYKNFGGRFREGDRKLATWFKEGWKDVGHQEYPVYRPTKRINKDTPLTVKEIDPQNLKKQIALKQKIKGRKNLPPFKRKTI